MGYRKVYIRMQSIERSMLEILKNKLSEVAAFLYMIDQREDHREIFLREDELKRRVRNETETAAETVSPR
jgi:hypothetical protein